MYSRIVNDRFQGDTSRYLGQNELPAQFNAFGENYCQSLVGTFVGAVNDLPAVSEAGASTLQDALELGLEISPGLIGTFGESSIAIFRSNELFFVFDSHSRNAMGLVDLQVPAYYRFLIVQIA